jgi:hypothetical protein
MSIINEIDRTKELMGILPEAINFGPRDLCLPKDYVPGKKYGREDLAKMFVCYTGKPNKFPVNVVKNWLFPFLPNGGFTPQDPMNMFDGLQKHTLRQLALAEDRDTRNITLKLGTIDSSLFHKRMNDWIKEKKSATHFDQRYQYQIDKIRNNNLNPISLTSLDNPIIFESENNKLMLLEGWHRVMAIIDLIKNGEMSQEQANVYVAIIYRSEFYKPVLIKKPKGMY